MRSLIIAIRSLFTPAPVTDYALEAGRYNSQAELAEQRAGDPAWAPARLSLAKPAHPNLMTGA